MSHSSPCAPPSLHFRAPLAQAKAAQPHATMASCIDDAALLTPPLSATDGEFDKGISLADVKAQLEDVAAGKPAGLRYERKMGDTELSYFLPSRASGTNDM